MKKSLSVFVLACMVLLLIPAAAFAAAAPVTVTVDGTAVKFANAPVHKSNVTLVEAKTIAAKLGATYAYDTAAKVVTLKYSAAAVKLTVGSKTAFVNGVKKTLALTPYAANGYVIVPAEFVVQSLGGLAKWDGASKLAVTSPAAVTKLSKQKALDLIKAYAAALSKEDIKAIKALYLPASWDADIEAGLKSQFADNAAAYSIRSSAIKSFAGTKATIEAELLVRYGNPYTIDEVYVITYELAKDAAGVWKLKSENLEDYNYDLPEQPAKTSADFAAGVSGAVQQLADSLNAEDLDAIEAMFDTESATAADQLDYWTYDFEDYDTAYEVSDTFIFRADEAKGTAAVVVTFEAADGEDAYSYEAALFLTKNADGKWIINEYYEL